MTHAEFIRWLEGYLQDRDTLTKKQIDLIAKKAGEAIPEYTPVYPYYPTYIPGPTYGPSYGGTTAPNAGPHYIYN